MREIELQYYVSAFNTVKKLEKESSEVRDYLFNLKFLKTIDRNTIDALKMELDEKDFEDLMKVADVSPRFQSVSSSGIESNERKKIVLDAGLIEEFQKVLNRGESSISCKVDLWDFLQKEVWIEVKYSVVRILDLDHRMLCTISGRPNFSERIANRVGLQIIRNRSSF